MGEVSLKNLRGLVEKNWGEGLIAEASTELQLESNENLKNWGGGLSTPKPDSNFAHVSTRCAVFMSTLAHAIAHSLHYIYIFLVFSDVL